MSIEKRKPQGVRTYAEGCGPKPGTNVTRPVDLGRKVQLTPNSEFTSLTMWGRNRRPGREHLILTHSSCRYPENRQTQHRLTALEMRIRVSRLSNSVRRLFNFGKNPCGLQTAFSACFARIFTVLITNEMTNVSSLFFQKTFQGTSVRRLPDANRRTSDD